MDPRPVPADPLASVDDDIVTLEAGGLSVDEQIDIFGRVHHALATALQGAGSEGTPRPGG